MTASKMFPEVIHRVDETGRERWPLLRVGERQPIPGIVRRLVFERDGRTCNHCGAPGDLQLDHIVPWSAFGSDRSDNLQTLCGACNSDRSNFVDMVPPRVVGVTAACDWCSEDPSRPPNYDGFDRIKAFCGRCGTTSWVSDERYIL